MLSIVTYNCKNIDTSKIAIEELRTEYSSDIILIQEHWCFDCKLQKLNEINSHYNSVGKAVDTGDPILPAQMPRGYGGTAILWRKEIDHVVNPISDGGNRIQCIEINGQDPLLVVSAYMPCRGLNDNVEDFVDCLDQLQEIVNKYSNTHSIVIGGDFNEDMKNRRNSKRAKELTQFMNELGLETVLTEPTYINPGGADTSIIDYIMYHKNISSKIISIEILESLNGNVSDHYPVYCKLKLNGKLTQISTNNNIERNSKIKWDRLDSDVYCAELNKSLPKLKDKVNSVAELELEVTKLNEILKSSAEASVPKRVRRIRKAKLKTWTPEIQIALAAKKKAFHEWKINGRSRNITDKTVINKKQTTRTLRRTCRVENAMKYNECRQEIIDARADNTVLFYKLIDKQRGKLKNCINELNVNGTTYNTDTDILEGFREHFRGLATANDSDIFDKNYNTIVEQELNEILDICENDNQTHIRVTEDEVTKAIKTLNKGKSADIFGVNVEHFRFGNEKLTTVTTELINKMFELGTVTPSMKLGTLTPVFKKKGSNLDSKNYRGITITATVSKIIESVLRERIRPIIDLNQNNLQRGFTKNSSPMNCSLILEEYIRDRKDSKTSTFIAFLDAKAAFDVVNHASLMRKLYHLGIEGKEWQLIHSLHNRAETVIKWNSQLSTRYTIEQGVRQGGILSADMYKIYVNRLLERLEDSPYGGHIGPINCVAPTCADDIAIVSDSPEGLQKLINIAADYSSMERYQLQPTKSVILPIKYTKKPQPGCDYEWKIRDSVMPIVDETMHVGLVRSANTEDTTVKANVKKARRTLYSLMGAGLHGENGYDPETSLRLLQTYVIPVLLYGLEVVLPNKKNTELLEKFYKKYTKHILSLPTTVADPAVYILSGTIPVEAQIHKRALTLLGNICRLPDSAVERQLAERQYHVKNHKSQSWFTDIRYLLVKYELPTLRELLDNSPSKANWKTKVNNSVNDYWTSRIKANASLYSSLKYLNANNFKSGKPHSLIRNVRNASEISRVNTKVKIATGTYILQENRASFNQNAISKTCQLCKLNDETPKHFILECKSLEAVRKPILDKITELYKTEHVHPNATESSNMLQLIIDQSAADSVEITNCKEEAIELEFQSRRLCYALHIERYKGLSLIPKRLRGGSKPLPK
ncbi:MAG: reverse transcriptase family protein [Sedimenticola sp.]